MQEMAALFGNEAIASTCRHDTQQEELEHYHKKPNIPMFTVPAQEK